VLLSPYCSVLKNLDVGPSAGTCPNVTSGSNLNDGAFVIYGTPNGTGVIQPAGGQLGLTGTIFAPQHSLNVSSGTRFQLIPGQALVLDATFNSGNALDPLIYWNDSVGGLLAAGLRTIK
jgi:hypothetical protein